MKPFNILRNEAGDGGDGGGGSSNAGQAQGGAGAAASGSGGTSTSLLAGDQSQANAANGGNASTGTAAANSQSGNASQAGAFDFRTLIGDDGKFVAGYQDKLPDNLKEHGKHFSKYADPLQALQHTLNLQQLLGQKADAVVIPGADAPKEAWAPVLKRLGVPDSPEGYGLKVPENLPEGVKVDEAELKEFATFAHGLGLTPQQVAKLQEFDLGRAAKSVSGSAEQAQAIEAQEFTKQKEILTKEWGNGPEAIKKNALAERAALTFGFSPEEVKSDPLFRNARFVMTLARAGAAMSEDTLVKGSDLNSTGGLKARASDVINNPQNPMYAKYWAGDEGVNNQVRNWMRAG